MSIIHKGDKEVRLLAKGAVRGGILLKGPRLGKAWDHRRVSGASHRTATGAIRISLCTITSGLRGRRITKEAVTKGTVTKVMVTKATVTEVTVTKVVVTQVKKVFLRHKGDHIREGLTKEESKSTHG